MQERVVHALHGVVIPSPCIKMVKEIHMVARVMIKPEKRKQFFLADIQSVFFFSPSHISLDTRRIVDVAMRNPYIIPPKSVDGRKNR